LTDSVDGIRWKIEELDNEILDLIKKRMQAALYMGGEKVRKGWPVRNMKVEEQVIGRYLERAREVGISDSAAAEIATILIRESVEAQGRMPRPGKPTNVLVIGGSGKMGQWFVRFLTERGHQVKIFDQAASKSSNTVASLKAGVKDAGMIIVATPISAANEVLEQLVALKPKGTIFDISSIKAPVIATARAAAANGLEICSLHPMFGPDAESIYNRNILVCDCGSLDATTKVTELFDGAGAKIITIPVEEHDELMSYVLGLSHAVNIAFFHTLAKAGIDIGRLDQASSTTFHSQAATSRRVANESPDLYYEIQHLNPHSQHCLDLLRESVADIEAAAMDADKKRFVGIMKEGKDYFGED
jgi:chorismate mutase / prephenate dehydrogenase